MSALERSPRATAARRADHFERASGRGRAALAPRRRRDARCEFDAARLLEERRAAQGGLDAARRARDGPRDGPRDCEDRSRRRRGPRDRPLSRDGGFGSGKHFGSGSLSKRRHAAIHGAFSSSLSRRAAVLATRPLLVLCLSSSDSTARPLGAASCAAAVTLHGTRHTRARTGSKVIAGARRAATANVGSAQPARDGRHPGNSSTSRARQERCVVARKHAGLPGPRLHAAHRPDARRRAARAEAASTGPGRIRCVKKTAPEFRRCKNQRKRSSSRPADVASRGGAATLPQSVVFASRRRAQASSASS